jgi:hypothetical protein
MAHGVAYPVTPEINTYNTNLDISLRAFFEHSTPADQALQSAQDAILSALAQNPATATPVP